MQLERYAVSVADMARLDGSSAATWWGRVKEGEIAFFRDGGRTKIIIDWPGTAPPREGRAPSYREYILEKIASKQEKRATPEGVHTGRPRLRPPAD